MFIMIDKTCLCKRRGKRKEKYFTIWEVVVSSCLSVRTAAVQGSFLQFIVDFHLDYVKFGSMVLFRKLPARPCACIEGTVKAGG